MNAYTFPRLRRLHRTAPMWPAWFFDVLHLATCELETGPMRRLDGAFLFNGALPDTGFQHRSHVAAVAAAEGRDVRAAEAQARRSAKQNRGWGAKVRAGIEAGVYAPHSQIRMGYPQHPLLARTHGSASDAEPA